MKIALVVPGGVDRSGERRVIPALLALIRRLSRGHEVHVFAVAQEEEAGAWVLEGARVHNTGAGWRYPRTVLAILREHGQGRFDVVQSIWAGGCGVIAVVAAKLLGVPGLVHVAGGEFVALPDIRYGGALRFKGRMSRIVVLRAASEITAASSPMLDHIRRLGRGAQGVALGVDTETWVAREPLRRDPGGPLRLIHVASLNRVKDQPTLLRALAILRTEGLEFHLDIAGEDTLNGGVQALARQLGLGSCITFHGFLTRRQLYPLMTNAHLHLVSSRHEAGPLALLEAAMVGVPTVGTAVGHVVEFAPAAAVQVPVGNATEFAAAITRVAQDEDLRFKLGAEALRRARLQDADRTYAGFAALYDRLQRLRSTMRK